MLGCAERVRHRRRLYGVDGLSESIDHLYGSHGAGRGVCGRRHEATRAVTTGGKMDRREFTKDLAAAGLAVAFPRVLRSTGRVARIEKVGLQLYTVRDKMKEDFEGTLAHAAMLANKEVESPATFNNRPAEWKATLTEHELPPPSTHAPS